MYSVIILIAAIMAWYYGCFKWQSKDTGTTTRLFSWFTFQALGIVTATVVSLKCDYGLIYQAIQNLDLAGYLTAVKYDPYLYSVLFLWVLDLMDNDSTRLKYRDGINAFGKEKAKKLIFSASGIATIFAIGAIGIVS